MKKNNMNSCKSTGSCLYFLGLIGAAVCFIKAATGFWAGALGLLKALIWPAILVYEALSKLGI